MNITDLKNESKELNKKLYEYVRQVIREIQTYNKMTDKEIADFLKLDVKALNMILTTDINSLVELYFIPINVISDIIVLSCNGINLNLNTMFDYEPKHTVQEIKQYIYTNKKNWKNWLICWESIWITRKKWKILLGNLKKLNRVIIKI